MSTEMPWQEQGGSEGGWGGGEGMSPSSLESPGPLTVSARRPSMARG